MLAQCRTKLQGYIALAAAIVNSGIAERDEKFLKSGWCEELKDAVISYNNLDTSRGLKAFTVANRGML